MGEKIEIRDTRNGEWSWVYNAVISDPHLSAFDVRAYGALSSFGGYQVMNPSMEQIAEKGQMSVRQAKISIKKLEDLEYITAEKGGGRGQSNVYYLLKKPKGCRICTDSKECKSRPETVQMTTVKGAVDALTIKIDTKIDSKKIYTDHFEKFWESYPKKIGKKKANEAWKKAKDKPFLEAILESVNKQKKCQQWQKDNGQFIPHPTTWLNQGRWDDVVEEEKQQGIISFKKN